MTPWGWFLTWLKGDLRRCPVCGKSFDVTRPRGTVLLESWGPDRSGVMAGSCISAGTCCAGTWYDRDYVSHPTAEEPQVNSKPTELLVPLSPEEFEWRAK